MASISLPLVHAPAECMRALFMQQTHTLYSFTRTHTIFYYIFMHSAFNRAINRSGLIISLAGEHTLSVLFAHANAARPFPEVKYVGAHRRISRNCIHSSRSPRVCLFTSGEMEVISGLHG